MKSYVTRLIPDGDGEILLIPPEIGFGVGAAVEIERRGEELRIQRKRMQSGLPGASNNK